MSIKTEIDRISNAKQTISQSISRGGVSVPSSAKIESYSSYIDTMVDNLSDFRVSDGILYLPEETSNVSGTTANLGLE